MLLFLRCSRTRRRSTYSAVVATTIGALLATLVAGAVWAQGTGTPGPTAPDPDAPGLDGGERLRALIERVEHERAARSSLRAAFVQVKEGPLLLEPEESHGTVTFAPPGRVRWEFRQPAMTVLVTDGTVTTWYRDLGEAERLELGERGDRMVSMFGAGASLASLERHFDLQAAFPEDPEASYRLTLLPRSRRLARRVKTVEMTIDRQLFAPRSLRIESGDGSVTRLEFDHLEPDVELAPGTFTLDLPEGVEWRSVAPPAVDGEAAG